MLRIGVSAYVLRYPLGGALSWNLQWLAGFKRLGHDVTLFERATYGDAFFDPIAREAKDDPGPGIGLVEPLLARFGLDDAWRVETIDGTSYGPAGRDVLKDLDVFIDLGNHGAWLDDLAPGTATVLVDGEPGYTQMRRSLAEQSGDRAAAYDHYFSNGASLETADYAGPTSGIRWLAVFNPVVPPARRPTPAAGDGPFTTLMNWQSHAPLEYEGRTWRQKDVEFERFIDLPKLTDRRLELAIAGPDVPRERLESAGWGPRDAIGQAVSYDDFIDLVRGSAGEFGVCKEGYVALRTGWFSDRSAMYLAQGRPVILQDTGFSDHLPCGKGLFAVGDAEEAAAAISEIDRDPLGNATAAYEIARDILSTDVVLPSLLRRIGA